MTGITLSVLASLASMSAAPVPGEGPLPPAEALAGFQLEDGLRIELVAAEPQVVDPVAMAFDERGRLYVVEMRDYPAEPAESRSQGRIALLEDRDGDGVFETRHEFADGLDSPNGIMCWGGGVFVTCAPDLLYLRDTTGDNRADERKVVFTGFSLGGSSQLRASHPTLGIDNWIYVANGLSGGSIVAPDLPDHPPVNIARSDFRFRLGPGRDPVPRAFEAIGGQAQFGLTFDDFGRRFTCSNRRHIDHVVMESGHLRRNPHLPFGETLEDISDHGGAARVFPISRAVTTAVSHAGTFTAACGLTIYRGTALPQAYQGNAFVCEPTGNLIHRDVLTPRGATFTARRGQEDREFLVSSDEWFRPVFLANGPDGALYVCDMYRKTIEHPQYLPEAIRRITDFESGKDHGRIYRITAEGATRRPPPVDLRGLEAPDLSALLSDQDSWWRETAQRLLLERGDEAVVAHLLRLTTLHRPPIAHVYILHALEALGELSDRTLIGMLSDPSPVRREHAVRLAEPRLPRSVSLNSKLMGMVRDDDARVRFHYALALGNSDDLRALPALAAIAHRDLPDRWVRAAVLSSIPPRPGAAIKFMSALLAQGLEDSRDGWHLMHQLGQMIGSVEPSFSVVACLDHIRQVAGSNEPVWALAFVRGIGESLERKTRPAGSLSALMRLLEDGENAEPARVFVSALTEQAIGQAVNEERSPPERLEAIGMLAHVDAEVGLPVLQDLLCPQQPLDVQLAAARALGAMKDPAVGEALLERSAWRRLSPAVREAVLSVLMQPRLLPLLLSAIEAGDIQPSAIDSVRRGQLLRHPDQSVRKRAQALFQDLETSDRKQVYDDYLSVLELKADPAGGQQVFTRHCAQCHQLGGQGVAVGPDLSGIRSQAPETLLLHILVPEHEITPGFTNYVVETEDGRIVTGLIASETSASVTLRRAHGEEETILRSNIASMYSSTLSAMPQEIENDMTRQELADLVGFLRGEVE